MKHYARISSFLLVFLALTGAVLAVPPPDFLFNVGAQIVQVFSIVALFASAALASASQFAKVYIARIKHKYVFWSALVIIALVVSGTAAYFYGQYEQGRAYDKWIAESEEQNKNSPTTDNSLDALRIIEDKDMADDSQAVPSRPPKIPRPRENKYIGFIRDYYANLAGGNIDAAYAVSKKSVSLETYRGWYRNVSAVSMDDIQEIEAKKYSLSLTLTEGDARTRYAVLMTLKEDADGTVSIASSEVRVLSGVAVAPSVSDTSSAPATPPAPPAPRIVAIENSYNDNDFFTNNQRLALSTTNREFQEILNSRQQIYVLDAREDEEYAIGQFPGSMHVRFADLLAGEWISLPTDRVVYVFCWSGMRGKEVADFLRSKKIVSRYVENGADGWVSFGGLWEGGIKFSLVYTDRQYKKLFGLNELKQKMSEGTVIVDSRMSSKFESWHIPGSFNIPIIYTTTSRMEEVLSQVPSGKSVITVCDDFISCFDAKITGVKLEKKGHEFLGRYNNPWEYRNSQ